MKRKKKKKIPVEYTPDSIILNNKEKAWTGD